MQTTSYSIASPVAIACGVAAAVGSTALLVRDAFVSGWTVELALMPVIVALTIAAAHMAWSAVRDCRLLRAVPLYLLTISGSCYIVYEQMGRRAEVRDVKVASAVDNSERRQDLRRKLAEAEAILVRHRAARDTECATGKGKACDGRSYTVQTWTAAVSGYTAELAKLGPSASSADPRADRVAAIVGLFAGARDADVKGLVALFEPVALPIILELGSIIFFTVGLASAPRTKTVVVVAAPEASVPEPVPTPHHGPSVPPGFLRKRTGRGLTDDVAFGIYQKEALEVGRPLTNSECMALWGEPKQTASDRRLRLGLRPSRTDGRTEPSMH